MNKDMVKPNSGQTSRRKHLAPVIGIGLSRQTGFDGCPGGAEQADRLADEKAGNDGDDQPTAPVEQARHDRHARVGECKDGQDDIA